MLAGGAGNDQMLGGLGRDSISGGVGNDVFLFASAAESAITATTSDVITDFVQGQDRIDLSALDAFAATAGVNDGFVWQGTATAFSNATAGEVRYQRFDVAGTVNDHTMVWIDNDADTGVEMAIRLTGLYTLTTADFIL